MKQLEDEQRIDYLVRVLQKFMSDTPAGEQTITYDEAECDGTCLVEDIANELEAIRPATPT